MATSTDRATLGALVRRQHWVVTREQLLAFGYTNSAIRHQVARRRLHVVHRGVYAVGRRELTREGLFIAAVLACGDGAALSHDSAAMLWGIRPAPPGAPEVTVPNARRRRRPGIRVHRSRIIDPTDITHRNGIPVTTVARTLIDLSPRLPRNQLERAINEADRLGLTNPERLRQSLEPRGREAAVLRHTLDRRTFRLTRSELERLFLPIALRAGLPLPETNRVVNGFEVDFYWPELDFVVETDGLRYHRTPAEQARDHLRDHAHAVADLERLRFTHEQIAFEAPYVERTLRAVHQRLKTRRLTRQSVGQKSDIIPRRATNEGAPS
jgi:very-short-patch-repair endonuclease